MRTYPTAIFLGVLTAVLLAGFPTAPPASAGEDDEAVIRQHAESFEKAFTAGDAATLVALLADGYKDINHPKPGVSREDMKKALTGLFTQVDSELDITPHEVIVAGDYAIVWGEYKQKLVLKASGEERDEHKRYLEILRRTEDGGWESYIGMDAPAPEASPEGGGH